MVVPESWSPEIERWFFSNVPTVMIFDDHEMIDDWNISDAWVRGIRQKDWWEDHVIGGLMRYWLYQHLGNLSPADIRAEGLLEALGQVADGEERLREWAMGAEEFTPTEGNYRFSFVRDIGRIRLVMIDSRERPRARTSQPADGERRRMGLGGRGMQRRRRPSPDRYVASGVRARRSARPAGVERSNL